MTLWLIFLVLTLATVALLVTPLLRRSGQAPRRIDYDLQVYRDQLAELDKEAERGLVTGDQLAAARTEIHRRILTAEEQEPAAEPARRRSNRARWTAALLVGVGLPAVAGALYIQLGSPALPGQPFASRQADPEFRMMAMADRLAADLKANPDADGFSTLAETYIALHRYPAAVEAFHQAIALGAEDPNLLASMGEAVVLSNDGMVVPEARRAFQQTLALDRNDPRARFYLGLAKAQIGKYAEAVAIWRDLELGSPEGAPWLIMLREHIEQFAKLGGIDPASVQPGPPVLAAGEGAAPPTSGVPAGPAAAAIAAQSPDEQARTIRGMVDGLAARLKEHPNDVEGWLQLSRSYRVLGEMAQAGDAARRAVALKPGDVGPKLALAQIQLAAGKGDGALPKDFIATVREILALEPGNSTALYYMGTAEAQAGHADEARKLWSKLLEVVPADAPERAELVRQLNALPKK